jgi:hypothetical protein
VRTADTITERPIARSVASHAITKLHHEPGPALQLTIDSLDDGWLTVAVEGDDESTSAWATVATFGGAAHEPADRSACLADPAPDLGL